MRRAYSLGFVLTPIPAVTLSLVLSLVGCEFHGEGRRPVLVIAVEGLGVEALSCDGDSANGEGNPGFNEFCQESIRFTHAYTPSSMSQSALASLLTGLYPFDHGVHHNGSEFLSARHLTLAEGALTRQYRTLFISGGPPIWRKSGLAQGFEVFDDSVDISPGHYYRPAREVFRLLTNWLDNDAAGQPFFAMVFLADLQFPQVPTYTDDGEVRETSLHGQTSELMESLSHLVNALKARKLWNSTHIVLVGLNGDPQSSRGPSPLSLHGAQTQVSLLIKPARKERDNVIYWAIDRNVSLVDVGLTMFDWLQLPGPKASLPELQPQSLNLALSTPEPRWDEDRLILVESAWPDWLEGAGVRRAVRMGKFLYVHDQKPLIYNTLTDRLESLPLKSNDPLWISVNGKILSLIPKAQFQPFRGMQRNWIETLEAAKDLWRTKGTPSGSAGGREPWAKWYMSHALTTRAWKEVKRLGQDMGDPVASYVAARHLGESLPVPRDACVRLVLPYRFERRPSPSDCEDERMRALFAWQSAKGEDDRQVALERFVRLTLQLKLDADIGRGNYLNDLRWDVDRELPEAPHPIDYLLTLKEFEGFTRKVTALIASKSLQL